MYESEQNSEVSEFPILSCLACLHLVTSVKTHLAKLVFNFVSSLSKIQKIYISAHDNFVTASLLLLLTTRK